METRPNGRTIAQEAQEPPETRGRPKMHPPEERGGARMSEDERGAENEEERGGARMREECAPRGVFATFAKTRMKWPETGCILLRLPEMA